MDKRQAYFHKSDMEARIGVSTTRNTNNSISISILIEWRAKLLLPLPSSFGRMVFFIIICKSIDLATFADGVRFYWRSFSNELHEHEPIIPKHQTECETNHTIIKPRARVRCFVAMVSFIFLLISSQIWYKPHLTCLCTIEHWIVFSWSMMRLATQKKSTTI